MVSSTPPGQERRAAPRFEILAQVRVKRGRMDYLMDVVNISRTGALVDMGALKSPTWLEVGRPVEMTLFLSDDLDTVALRGEIVRLVEDDKNKGFAVHFDDMEAVVLAELESLLRRARVPGAGPPPLPET